MANYLDKLYLWELLLQDTKKSFVTDNVLVSAALIVDHTLIEIFLGAVRDDLFPTRRTRFCIGFDKPEVVCTCKSGLSNSQNFTLQLKNRPNSGLKIIIQPIPKRLHFRSGRTYLPTPPVHDNSVLATPEQANSAHSIRSVVTYKKTPIHLKHTHEKLRFVFIPFDPSDAGIGLFQRGPSNPTTMRTGLVIEHLESHPSDDALHPINRSNVA